ncbi:hypothetical protein [Desulfopila sp. IMCC35006]|uniref:hypothetical protein n=1 Tax=Desulfopila sp. IMCC35006 TaxID=2569542 RepID=UPI00197ACC1E|nr:hypothetical protein [Desulfopila sp. IMCC35006]
MAFNILKNCADRWPIDAGSARPPDNWTGWPDNKKFALVLTHDVDTRKGFDNAAALMKVDQEMGFRAAFNFVPERDYSPSPEFRQQFESNGFEIGVHDLKHDGKLFKSAATFTEGAQRINRYLKEWESKGFRSGSMHCNLDWIQQLHIEYDASTFDTDPFEPKPESRRTIFPFWVEPNGFGNAFIELPYTLPQDFTLFVLMQEKNIAIWKKKLDWIAEQGGMALVLTHPDYMNFGEGLPGQEEYPVRFYTELLEYIKSKYEGQYWHVLPREIACFMRENIG